MIGDAPPLVEQFSEIKMIKKYKHSTVYLCEHLLTGVKIDIEKFIYDGIPSQSIQQVISYQSINRKLLSSVTTYQRTLNIMRGFGYTWFVEEDLEGVDPVTFVKDDPLSIQQVKYLFFLYTKTILHLHNHGIALVDWSPHNFRLVHTFVKFIEYNSLRATTRLSNQDSIHWLGDPCWMAPETIMADSYELINADIWCLGLTLYLLLVGKPLITNTQDIYKQLHEFELKLPKNIDHDAADLLKSILVIDPEKRPTLQKILSHAFLHPMIPFPMLQSPQDVHQDIIDWLKYFHLNVERTIEDVRAFIIDNKTFIYYLVSIAVKRGITVNDVRQIFPYEMKKLKTSYIKLPESIVLTDDNELDITRQRQESRAEKKAKEQQRRNELRKLLKQANNHLEERGITIMHVQSYLTDDD